jgi:hypothetical protein
MTLVETEKIIGSKRAISCLECKKIIREVFDERFFLIKMVI